MPVYVLAPPYRIYDYIGPDYSSFYGYDQGFFRFSHEYDDVQKFLDKCALAIFSPELPFGLDD